jgi:hypothetical protein
MNGNLISHDPNYSFYHSSYSYLFLFKPDYWKYYLISILIELLFVLRNNCRGDFSSIKKNKKPTIFNPPTITIKSIKWWNDIWLISKESAKLYIGFASRWIMYFNTRMNLIFSSIISFIITKINICTITLFRIIIW